jgi:parallel beta-helix repeat protein
MKRTLALTLILPLLVSAVAGAGFVELAWANGIPMPPLSQIYIKSDGSVEPSTASLQREGNTYTVVGSLPDSSIEVQRDNIIIDGSGFTLSGYGSHWYAGITVSNVNSVKIQNMTIRGFGRGVNLVNSSNNIIIGNKIEGCAYAVSLSSSDGNCIAENSMSYSYGVSGKGSFNVIIENNFTSGLSGPGQGIGVDFWGSNNNTISGNHFVDEFSISVRGNYNTVSYNTLTDGEAGIFLIDASYNQVFRNTIKGKTDSGSGALYLARANNNKIYENHIENNALGVCVGNPIDSNTAGNTFYRNNFLNNNQNTLFYGTPTNFWDNDQEGNYWSDYAGNDTDGDGIGDTPYTINVNNVDHYPLMRSISIPNAPDFTLVFPMPTTKMSPSPSPTPTINPISPSPSSSPTPSPSTSPSPTEQSPNPQSEPFPTELAITASGALVPIIGAGLFVYFKKRKR